MNVLSPASHQARDIASLWWWMLGASGVGFAVVVGLLVAAWMRRRRPATADDEISTRFVVALGIVVPILVIGSLFVIANIFVIRTTQAPAGTATRLTVRVIGHDWWWEVRYPGTSVVTANEIHIPTRTPILLEATTADVIHSFWVPELNRKIDTIPGRLNKIELEADRPGYFRGQCAEFCGLQHAHMALAVYAQTPAEFRRWLAQQKQPVQPSNTVGGQLFLDGTCSECHTIRGTSADGTTGPDLTHLASRATIAALTLPNTPSNLAAWITHNQQIKPGNKMIDVQLPPAKLRALVAYLESLR
ncbi:MAG TPA: cytochrome c oxidase subunit II [Gaiellaceae bacterium]|nr:cytochrome c oxidase subunit II [Gaiellaceae bacterium]